MAYDPVVASVTLTGSLLSLVASTCVLISFTVYHKEQRSFRHALVLNLTLAEFINSLDNSISGIIYMRDHELFPGASCVVNGLVGQISVQAVDFSILAIAVVTLLTVTRTTFMPGVSRLTKILVCLSVWVVPLTTGLTATAMGAMTPVGTNWCWITAARPDLRYALTHGWRFAIIFGTVAIYLYIWYYLRNHFRSMGMALKTGWSQLSAAGQQMDGSGNNNNNNNSNNNNYPGALGVLGPFQTDEQGGKEKEEGPSVETVENRQRQDSLARGRTDSVKPLAIPPAAAKPESRGGFGMSFYNDNRSSLGEEYEDREKLLTPIERERLADEELARKQRLQARTGSKPGALTWDLPGIPNTPLGSGPGTPNGTHTIRIGFAVTTDSPQLSPRGSRPARPEPAHRRRRSVSDASDLAAAATAAAADPAQQQSHRRNASDSTILIDDSRASVGSTYSLFPNAKTSAARRSGPAEGFGPSAAQPQHQDEAHGKGAAAAAAEDSSREWPSVLPWKSQATGAAAPSRRPTNVSEFPMRQEKRHMDREVQRMLLLNAYPILYVLLWIPGLINRLMEAAGHPLTGRAAQALQSSSQYIGLANALTYGFNRHIRHRITGDLLQKLRLESVKEIISPRPKQVG
ncbi:hypothetical protein RB594_003246 [Gaeumannomyces avenae]